MPRRIGGGAFAEAVAAQLEGVREARLQEEREVRQVASPVGSGCPRWTAHAADSGARRRLAVHAAPDSS